MRRRHDAHVEPSHAACRPRGAPRPPAARAAASSAAARWRRRSRPGTACRRGRPSNSPSRSATAPVNAPRAWPNSSLSISVSGVAPQLCATKPRVAPRAQRVQRARDQLLAGAGLAQHQHRQVARRDRAAARRTTSRHAGDSPSSSGTGAAPARSIVRRSILPTSSTTTSPAGAYVTIDPLRAARAGDDRRRARHTRSPRARQRRASDRARASARATTTIPIPRLSAVRASSSGTSPAGNQPAEQRRPRPGVRIEPRAAALGQHAHQVAGDAAAGDVRERVHAPCSSSGISAGAVPAVRREQRVAERLARAAGQRVARASSPERVQHAARQREAVGVESRGRESEHARRRAARASRRAAPPAATAPIMQPATSTTPGR